MISLVSMKSRAMKALAGLVYLTLCSLASADDPKVPPTTAPPPVPTPTPDCSDPCNQDPPIDHRHFAGVACCGGEQYPCVWLQNIPPLPPDVEAIFKDCATKHELNHIQYPNHICHQGRGATAQDDDGINRDGNLTECRAYTEELACLEGKDCGGDAACEAWLASRKNTVTREKNKYCGAPHPEPPPTQIPTPSPTPSPTPDPKDTN